MGLRSDAAANRDLITLWVPDVNPIKSASSKCASSCKQGVLVISSAVLLILDLQPYMIRCPQNYSSKQHI